MISDLTEAGDAALRAVQTGLEQGKAADAFERGYLQGQLAIIKIFLFPNAVLLAEVSAAVERMPRAD